MMEFGDLLWFEKKYAVIQRCFQELGRETFTVDLWKCDEHDLHATDLLPCLRGVTTHVIGTPKLLWVLQDLLWCLHRVSLRG